jgi:hypothetical protein
MDCTGSFEIRGGPAKGETRQIDCWSHRDHTWTSRFAKPERWKVVEGHFPGHFWPSVQLPDRHINIFGLYMQNEAAPKDRYIGGFVSDEDGSRPLLNAVAEIAPNDGSPSVRSANSFRYAFTMPDGEVIHVRSTNHHGTIKLWLRAENDLENRMDCYEAFCDFEVEETGEVGTVPSAAAPHDILDLGRCNCNASKAQGISGGVVAPLAARLSPLTTKLCGSIWTA